MIITWLILLLAWFAESFTVPDFAHNIQDCFGFTIVIQDATAFSLRLDFTQEESENK